MVAKHFLAGKALRKLGGVLMGLVAAFVMVGCDRPFVGGMDHIYSVRIDSAATCCGIDSFVIKSPWAQEKINTFLADSADRKKSLVSDFRMSLCRDSVGDDFIWIETEWKYSFYTCCGDTLPKKELNGYLGDEYIKELVEISIGLIPLE